ncbi:MAG: hypothetical protein HBSAPP03_27000 [Phycisphaerae bacterium]|nr:MAG: hypothetical protein HBSAPP03_27000 [Phycisphaerae bacterium]
MSPTEVESALKSLPEWSGVGETIQRTYQFVDFVTAMTFVAQVAQHAEAVQHHPDIMIRYSKVTLTYSTHDAGGLTRKDFDAAAKADLLAAALPAAPKAPAKAARKKK